MLFKYLFFVSFNISVFVLCFCIIVNKRQFLLLFRKAILPSLYITFLLSDYFYRSKFLDLYNIVCPRFFEAVPAYMKSPYSITDKISIQALTVKIVPYFRK